MKKFIPKLTSYDLLETSTDEFFVGADVVLRLYKLFQTASSKIPEFVIDPKTNALPYNSNSTMEKLPYYFCKSDFEKILNDSALRLNKLIIPCIDFQIEHGSKKLVPPYFYTEDVTSQTFNVNLENITNVIKYMEKIDGEYAIYPFINISANILSNDNLIRYIVSAYTSDEFNSHIKGFYLMIDGLDTNLVSEEDLRGLLKLVKGLSHKEVYIVSINAFGYATLLLGATGFVSGLASNETTSVETWKLDIEERKKLRSRSREFTYVPEVFTYITEYELQQIGYSCSCAHCKNSLPLKPSDKKIHFYECRKRDIENIFTGDFKQNYSALLKCYEQGRDEARKLLLERKTTRNSNIILTPISKWISALQEAENIEKQDEAEIKLTQILEDIDNYDKSSN